MCTITLNIDETLVRKANPALTSLEDITRWAQQLVNDCIADLLPGKQDIQLPPYTIEELHDRIAKSERDLAEGRYA